MLTAARRYRAAGVDEDAAARLARFAMRRAAGQRPDSYAALSPLPRGSGRPLVATCCDGVGSKLLLLRDHDRLAVAGWDVVAACVNDLCCSGARPWQFLDALSCHRLDENAGRQLLRGVAKACRASGCDLAGGEIAQLPDQLRYRAWDLVGFATGVVAPAKRLPRRGIKPGDVLLGLLTDRPHANGYTLVRRILSQHEPSRRMQGLLLAPTPLYAPLVVQIQRSTLAPALLAAMHITGGGLAGNAARGLPAGLGARIEEGSWPQPPLFAWLAQHGQLDDEEMRATFNCGIGMVWCVAADRAAAMLRKLERLGWAARQIGVVKRGRGVDFRQP